MFVISPRNHPQTSTPTPYLPPSSRRDCLLRCFDCYYHAINNIRLHSINKYKNALPVVRSKILSKLFASCVWCSDRAYCWVCVLINDMDRRLPLELQCSLYQGQKGDTWSDVSQSARGMFSLYILNISGDSVHPRALLVKYRNINILYRCGYYPVRHHSTFSKYTVIIKATIGGVPPFSLVCLSHSHE